MSANSSRTIRPAVDTGSSLTRSTSSIGHMFKYEAKKSSSVIQTAKITLSSQWETPIFTAIIKQYNMYSYQFASPSNVSAELQSRAN